MVRGDLSDKVGGWVGVRAGGEQGEGKEAMPGAPVDKGDMYRVGEGGLFAWWERCVYRGGGLRGEND